MPGYPDDFFTCAVAGSTLALHMEAVKKQCVGHFCTKSFIHLVGVKTDLDVQPVFGHVYDI